MVDGSGCDGRRVLITGGAGFIGSHIGERLLSMGWQVRVLDNLSEQVHGKDPRKTSPLFSSLDDRAEFILGTVTSRDDWAKALVDQDVVVHLAAETGTGQSMYLVERYADVNVRGTSILLDMLSNSNHCVQKVVVASSRAVYGEGKYRSPELGFVYPESRRDADMKAGRFEVSCPGSSPLEVIPTDEGAKLHPSSVYGITKQIQEQLVMNVCAARNIPAVSFRYQNVYGPGQSLSNPYTGILSIFANRIRDSMPINVFEDGNESRDFVFITDVVDATVAGIISDAANGEIFNVGSGRRTTILDIAHRLVDLFGAGVPIEVSGMYRVGDIRHNVADVGKLSRVLGVEPRVALEEGLARFVAWARQQNVVGGDHEKSLEEMRMRGLGRLC